MKDILDLNGRVALVTGAGQNVGREIALYLGAHNAGGVVVNDYVLERAQAVANEIKEDGGKAIAIQADATDVKAVEAAVEKTFATYLPLSIQHHARLVSANQHPLPLQDRGSGG